MVTSIAAREYDFFVCSGCRRDVYLFPAQDPTPTQCATCLLLDEFIDDPVEREELRQRLMMGEP